MGRGQRHLSAGAKAAQAAPPALLVLERQLLGLAGEYHAWNEAPVATWLSEEKQAVGTDDRRRVLLAAILPLSHEVRQTLCARRKRQSVIEDYPEHILRWFLEWTLKNEERAEIRRRAVVDRAELHPRLDTYLLAAQTLVEPGMVRDLRLRSSPNAAPAYFARVGVHEIPRDYDLELSLATLTISDLARYYQAGFRLQVHLIGAGKGVRKLPDRTEWDRRERKVARAILEDTHLLFGKYLVDLPDAQ